MMYCEILRRARTKRSTEAMDAMIAISRAMMILLATKRSFMDLFYWVTGLYGLLVLDRNKKWAQIF